MALIWTDSCNVHGTSLGVRYDSSAINSTAGGRFEGNSYRFDSSFGNNVVRKTSAFTNDSFMVIAGNFRLITTSAIIAVRDGSTEQVRVVVNHSATPGAASIAAYRGPQTTLLSSVSGLTIFTSEWYYIEVEVVVNDSSGYVKVYLDGTQVLSVTSVDTQNTSNAFANGFILTSGLGSMQVDEFYVLNGQGSVNNARLGPKRVTSFNLAADGNSSQWTPSTGSDNYALVDERNSLSTSDYVSSDTANDLDLYTLTGKSLPDIGFVGVNVITVAHESGLTSRQIRAALRSGGNDYFGATKDLESAVRAYTNIWEDNPDTSSPFTSSEIDALEIGQELVS